MLCATNMSRRLWRVSLHSSSECELRLVLGSGVGSGFPDSFLFGSLGLTMEYFAPGSRR